MPFVYAYFFFFLIIWNAFYTLSYGRFEMKNGNFVGFCGVIILNIVIFALFFTNFSNF